MTKSRLNVDLTCLNYHVVIYASMRERVFFHRNVSIRNHKRILRDGGYIVAGMSASHDRKFALKSKGSYCYRDPAVHLFLNSHAKTHSKSCEGHYGHIHFLMDGENRKIKKERDEESHFIELRNAPQRHTLCTLLLFAMPVRASAWLYPH
jgi:hypothetical protein